MAIIENLALGKTAGKIGNIVYYELNGQQVARAYVPTINDLNSVNQRYQRAKLSNAVMCYQLLKQFLEFTTQLRRSNETKYNMFLRLIMQFMYTIVMPSRKAALLSIYNNYLGSTPWLFVTDVIHLGSTLTVFYDTKSYTFSTDIYLRVIAWESNSEQMSIRNFLINETDYLNGYIDINLGSQYNTLPACYIWGSEGSVCSNIVFHT